MLPFEATLYDSDGSSRHDGRSPACRGAGAGGRRRCGGAAWASVPEWRL